MSNESANNTRKPVICPSCGGTDMTRRDEGILIMDWFEILSLGVYSLLFSGIATYLLFLAVNELSFEPVGPVGVVIIFLICLPFAIAAAYAMVMAHITEQNIRNGIDVSKVVCDNCHLSMRIVRPRETSEFEDDDFLNDTFPL